MRIVLALVVAALAFVGTVGCGGPDPATKPGFNKAAIDPSKSSMPPTPDKMPKAPGGAKT